MPLLCSVFRAYITALHNCSCQVSFIANRFQLCGVRPYGAGPQKCAVPNANIMPSCPRHPITSPNVTISQQQTPVQTTDIVAYSMSFDMNKTQARLDKYLPSSVFKGIAIPAVRADPGLMGYRLSIKAALTKGLTETNSSLIAIFDDDFRISKSFDQRWAELTESPTTCYHDTLARGGVFVFGFSGRAGLLKQQMRDCQAQMTHDEGLCIDATPFSLGSFANIFSRPAAEFALQWLEKTYDERPFDWIWQDMVLLGYPVRGPLNPLFTADCAPKSSVTGSQITVQTRHKNHHWGPVENFLPRAGQL